MKNALRILGAAQEWTLDLFGEIGFAFWGDGFDAASVRAQLAGAKGGKLLVTIDSPGGSVSDALAMYNIVRDVGAEVTVRVQGIAASAASYLAMAADPGRLEMPANTLLMVHKPWLYTAGNSDELRRDAEALDRFEAAITTGYARHWKGTPEELSAAIAAETWLTAAEAAERFGAVVIGEPFAAAAMLDLSALGTVPQAALAFGTPTAPTITMTAEALAARDAEVMARADGIYQPQLADARARATAAEARAEAAETGRRDAEAQLVAAKADAADTRALLERVTGRGVFAGDSEGAGAMTWAQALEKCGGDYAEARKRYPAAYAADREEARKRRS